MTIIYLHDYYLLEFITNYTGRTVIDVIILTYITGTEEHTNTKKGNILYFLMEIL